MLFESHYAGFLINFFLQTIVVKAAMVETTSFETFSS